LADVQTLNMFVKIFNAFYQLRLVCVSPDKVGLFYIHSLLKNLNRIESRITAFRARWHWGTGRRITSTLRQRFR